MSNSLHSVIPKIGDGITFSPQNVRKRVNRTPEIRLVMPARPMVIDFHLPLHEALPRSVKGAQTLFFLAIHADNGAIRTHGEYQAENNLELLVPCGISPGGQVFALFSVLEAHQAQFDFDLAVADWDAMRFEEKTGQLFGLQVRPKHAAVCWAARFVLVYQRFQQGGRVRELGKIFSCHRPACVDDPLEFGPEVPGCSSRLLPCESPCG